METIQEIRDQSKSLSIVIIDLELEILALQITQNRIKEQLEKLFERVNDLERKETAV